MGEKRNEEGVRPNVWGQSKMWVDKTYQHMSGNPATISGVPETDLILTQTGFRPPIPQFLLCKIPCSSMQDTERFDGQWF